MTKKTTITDKDIKALEATKTVKLEGKESNQFFDLDNAAQSFMLANMGLAAGDHVKKDAEGLVELHQTMMKTMNLIYPLKSNLGGAIDAAPIQEAFTKVYNALEPNNEIGAFAQESINAAFKTMGLDPIDNTQQAPKGPMDHATRPSTNTRNR